MAPAVLRQRRDAALAYQQVKRIARDYLGIG